MASIDWASVFQEALAYSDFLDKYATPPHRDRWNASHARFQIEPDQTTLLGTFVRKLPVLCLAGTWCGDCINQCPIFDHFAAASKVLDLKFLDRDARDDAKVALAVNGGNRVPIVVFLSEDFQEVARYGDRTISRYRQLASEQLGPSCPTGIVPPSNEATTEVVREWFDEFERAQLILRLSPRLRQKYGD